MYDRLEQATPILERLGGNDEIDLLQSLRELEQTFPRRQGWRQYSAVLASSVKRRGWGFNLRTPLESVRLQCQALGSIVERAGVTLEIQPDERSLDVVIGFPAALSASDQSLVIGWLVSELSVSTVPDHRLRCAVGTRVDQGRYRLRVVPPPRISRWLGLFGMFGSALSAELRRQHELLLQTEDEISTVGETADVAERELDALLETLNEGYLQVSTKTGELFASRRFTQLTELAPSNVDELIASWLERTPIEHLESTEAGLEAFRDGKPGVYALGLVHARTVRVFEFAVYRAEESVTATLADATAKHLAMERSRMRRRAIHTLLESAPFAIAVHRENEVLYANEQFRTEIESRLNAVTDDVVKVNRRSNSILPNTSIEVMDEAGISRSFDLHTSLVEWDSDGAFLTIFRDTTDERTLLAKSFELDRIVALGTLADGVAHEMNNPLAYVQSNLEYALEAADGIDPEFGEEIAAALKDALDGASRVSELVADFRQVAPGQADHTVGAVDLHEVVAAAINLANATVRERANISTSIEVSSPVVASSSRLSQVFINLLVNAAQAIPDDRRGQIHVRAFNPLPDRVTVEVRDNGTGIDEATLEEVFKPFFTTKPPGEGTGLGLSICRNIIEQFGGALRIESQVGRGTVVFVDLQVAEVPADVQSFVSEVSEAVDGASLILVVDDDAQILRMASRILGNQHKVVTTNDPRKALELAKAATFDLVLSDVLMPRISGTELARRLVEVDASYRNRIVLMTGGRGSGGAGEHRYPLIEKPFGMRDLRRMVRDHLQGKGGRR